VTSRRRSREQGRYAGADCGGDVVNGFARVEHDEPPGFGVGEFKVGGADAFVKVALFGFEPVVAGAGVVESLATGRRVEVEHDREVGKEVLGGPQGDVAHG